MHRRIMPNQQQAQNLTVKAQARGVTPWSRLCRPKSGLAKVRPSRFRPLQRRRLDGHHSNCLLRGDSWPEAQPSSWTMTSTWRPSWCSHPTKTLVPTKKRLQPLGFDQKTQKSPQITSAQPQNSASHVACRYCSSPRHQEQPPGCGPAPGSPRLSSPALSTRWSRCRRSNTCYWIWPFGQARQSSVRGNSLQPYRKPRHSARPDPVPPIGNTCEETGLRTHRPRQG